MSEKLEKILGEIEENKHIVEIFGRGVYFVPLEATKQIIRKHMDDGWIPVDKNNVPDHEILACDRYKNELIGYLSYNADSEEFVCESDECIMYQVIAWMEKPEPYRPERSEEE